MNKNASGWTRNLLSDPSLRPRIDRWLRTVAGGLELKMVRGDPETYGSGHYGSAFALDGSDGERWVLKVTRDPTEGPMCDFIGYYQSEKQLLRSGFARFESVARMPDRLLWRGKTWPVYLIVREEIENPGQVFQLDYEAARRIAILQTAARAMTKKTPRGRMIWGLWKNGFPPKHKEPADIAWDDAIDWLLARPGVSSMAQDLRYLREIGITLLDVHFGNVGRRGHPQMWSHDRNVDGTNVGDWIIFDPGHTPTAEHRRVIKTLPNPPCRVLRA